MTQEFDQQIAPPIYPSYNDIHNECVDYANLILQQNIKFDCVVGLARGGIFPSMLISRLLDIPLHITSYSSRNGKGDKLAVILDDVAVLQSQRILLVDDICDTGETLSDICEYYEMLGNTVTTYAVYYKMLQNPIHTPNYSIGITEDAGWVCFPFEETSLIK